MPRTVEAPAAAALGASHVDLAVFVQFDLPSGMLRFTSREHTLEWDGSNWLGAGRLGNLEPITETVSPEAAALQCTFSGVDPAYVSAILGDHYQGRSAAVWLATLEAPGLAVTDAPVQVFAGRLDEPVVTVGDTAAIQISMESRMADWDRPRLRRYNDADQQARHAGDKGLEYAEANEDAMIVWGIYRGPVAPDPVKIFNRTIDRVLSHPLAKLATLGLGKPVANAGRAVGDAISRLGRSLGF